MALPSFKMRSMCNNFVGVDAEPELKITQSRKITPVVLPTICEVSKFGEEDYYKQVMRQRRMSVSSAAFEHEEYHGQTLQERKMAARSKQIMARLIRSGQSGLPRQTAEVVPEDEQPLLDHPEEFGTSKPCKWKWKMPKKGVKVWPGSSSCEGRSQARRATKVMSPLRLLRTMRDAYVRALTRLGNKCTPTSSSIGARGGF